MGRLNEEFEALHEEFGHDPKVMRVKRADFLYGLKEVELDETHADDSLWRTYCQQPEYAADNSKLSVSDPEQHAKNRALEDELSKKHNIPRWHKFEKGQKLAVATFSRAGDLTLYTGDVHTTPDGAQGRVTIRSHIRRCKRPG